MKGDAFASGQRDTGHGPAADLLERMARDAAGGFHAAKGRVAAKTVRVDVAVALEEMPGTQHRLVVPVGEASPEEQQDGGQDSDPPHWPHQKSRTVATWTSDRIAKLRVSGM